MTLDHVVEYIANEIRKAEKTSNQAEVNEFQAEPSKCDIAAVDGGSTVVLEACDFIVGAYRAGHARYAKGQPGSMSVPAPETSLISRENAASLCARKYRDLAGSEPPATESDPVRTLSFLRELSEVSEVVKLVDALPEGSLIVLDGSLDFGSMLPERFVSDLEQALDKKDLSLAAVSKSTSLRVSGVPFCLAFLGVRSRSAWYSPVKADGLRIGSGYAVRFNPASRRAFRVDVRSRDVGRALSVLAGYADDPFYPGYPYPLAQIHNKVSIPVHEREDIASQIERKLSPSHHEAFEALFSDFHEVLDMAR